MSESPNSRISEFPKSGFASSYKDLNVYKKAFSVSLDIHKSTSEFPKTEQHALASQMRRASKSICANLAEGFAKQQSSKAEFKRFTMIAIGSAHEMQVWCEYCIELGYIDQKTFQEWTDAYDHIVRMLQSLYSKT